MGGSAQAPSADQDIVIKTTTTTAFERLNSPKNFSRSD